MITAEIASKDIDTNGNIRVISSYVFSDGKRVSIPLTYNYQNFSREQVLADIKSQSENLMRKTYNSELMKQDISDLSYSCDSVELVLKPELKDISGTIIQQREAIVIDEVGIRVK
jgi:hypothetical protein